MIALIVSKIPLIVSAILIIIVGFAVSNMTGKLIIKGLKAKGVDPSVHTFIKTCITLIMKFAFVLSAISTFGINVSSFLAAIGAAGVTAGLGLQSSVSQLASGVQILMNHPFKSGDYVELGTISGKVHEIKLMYTVLITMDNKQVIVPNSTITTSNIVNYNANNKRRLDLVYSVAYNEDIEKVRSVILETVKSNSLILNDPEPIVAVKEHGQSSINFACLIWCKSDNYWTVFYYMQEQIKNAFDKNGITIPYNQLDVHINKEN
jgi:small conductance mechanosensitive channel